MLTKLLLIGIIIGWTGFCTRSIQPETTSVSAPESAMSSSADVTFEEDVLPVLKANCNPCHFPGGKLYEKLPFDQPATIITHSEAILKRIKKEEEAEKIRRFVEQAAGHAKS